MDSIRRVAPTFVLWGAVFAGAGVLVAACWWGPTVVHRVGSMADDPRPGARRVATPEELVRAQANWKRRHGDPAGRYTRGQLGPSPQQVIDAVGRRGYPSPPDVLDPE